MVRYHPMRVRVLLTAAVFVMAQVDVAHATVTHGPGDGAVIGHTTSGAAPGQDHLASDDPVLQVKNADAEVAWSQLQRLRSHRDGGLASLGPEDRQAYADCPDGDCSWRTVGAIYQYAQSKSYYCGPATLKSLVRARGVSISQATAATWSNLRTEYYTGTPWYDGTYPFVTALNNYLSPYGATYYAAAVDGGGGTSAQKTAFRRGYVW